MTYSKEEKREKIVKHYFEPDNKGTLDTNKIREISGEGCSDSMTIYMSDDKEIKFISKACSISTASTDLLINQIKDKNEEDAIQIIQNYKNMINGKDYDSNLISELELFTNIRETKKRIECALLSTDELISLIREK